MTGVYLSITKPDVYLVSGKLPCLLFFCDSKEREV